MRRPGKARRSVWSRGTEDSAEFLVVGLFGDAGRCCSGLHDGFLGAGTEGFVVGAATDAPGEVLGGSGVVATIVKEVAEDDPGVVRGGVRFDGGLGGGDGLLVVFE